MTDPFKAVTKQDGARLRKYYKNCNYGARLVPDVLHNDESAQTESFHNDLLEYPQYSRPEIWRDKAVPPILLSGNHAKVDEWRLEQSIERTKRLRPDLYEKWETRQ